MLNQFTISSKKVNKKLLVAIFTISIIFQALSFSLNSLDDKPNYYENCSTTFHKELSVDTKSSSPNGIIIKYDVFPIYPEIENIKCLNKIIGKSIDVQTSKTTYRVGYSNFIYYFQFLAFLLGILLNFRFFKFNYLEILILLNVFLFFQFRGIPVYIMLTQILKLNIFLLTLGIFIYNFKNIYLKNNYELKIAKNNERFISYFLINICLFIFFEHMKNFHYKAYYIHLSEWASNYTGGMNRRGLIGEIITSVYSGNNLKIVIVFLITIVYSWLILNIYIIFKKINQNYLSIFILLSPFYVLFSINDFRGGNSKELIGFLALTLLILYDIYKSNAYLLLSLLVYFIGVFSHNLNIFLFPGIIFYIFVISKIQKKTYISSFYLIIVLANIIIYFSPFMQDSYFDIKIWCNDLITNYNLYETCFELRDGNLLDLKINDGVLLNIEYTKNNLNLATVLNYSIIFLFINFYIVKTKYFNRFFKQTLAIYLSFIPLFILALDWGRWQNILFFSLFTIYLGDKSKDSHIKNLFMTLLIVTIPTFVIYNPHCCAQFSIRNILSYNLDSFHLFDFFTKIYSF
jgi:hypothetical protein